MVVIVVDDLVGGASVDEGFDENSSDVRDEFVIFIVVVRIVEIFGHFRTVARVVLPGSDIETCQQ